MSISLDGLSSLYTDTNSTSSTQLDSKLQNTDYSSATDEELLDACKQFESYLIEQVYKEMEKMVPENEDEDSTTSQLTDYFKDEMIQNLSETTSDQGSLGIAQSLYEQMKRNYNL